MILLCRKSCQISIVTSYQIGYNCTIFKEIASDTIRNCHKWNQFKIHSKIISTCIFYQNYLECQSILIQKIYLSSLNFCYNFFDQIVDKFSFDTLVLNFPFYSLCKQQTLLRVNSYKLIDNRRVFVSPQLLPPKFSNICIQYCI